MGWLGAGSGSGTDCHTRPSRPWPGLKLSQQQTTNSTRTLVARTRPDYRLQPLNQLAKSSPTRTSDQHNSIPSFIFRAPVAADLACHDRPRHPRAVSVKWMTYHLMRMVEI